MRAPDPPAPPDDAVTPFGRQLVQVLLVQVVTLVALYLFGRYFA